jgi:hypothetical protein
VVTFRRKNFLLCTLIVVTCKTTNLVVGWVTLAILSTTGSCSSVVELKNPAQRFSDRSWYARKTAVVPGKD